MHINLSLWFNFQELNTTASQCLPSLLCTAILCSSLCILIANRPIGFTHPLDFGDLHPASNCCSSSLLNIDVTSFQPRKLAPWTYTEKQTSSLIRITDLQARSVAASADSGWPIGSNSPTSGVLWSWEHSSSTQPAETAAFWKQAGWVTAARALSGWAKSTKPCQFAEAGKWCQWVQLGSWRLFCRQECWLHFSISQ